MTHNVLYIRSKYVALSRCSLADFPSIDYLIIQSKSTMSGPAWGLNSKQLDFLSPKELGETVVAEYVLELDAKHPCTIAWGLINEPVVGEGSGCKRKRIWILK